MVVGGYRYHQDAILVRFFPLSIQETRLTYAIPTTHLHLARNVPGLALRDRHSLPRVIKLIDDGEAFVKGLGDCRTCGNA